MKVELIGGYYTGNCCTIGGLIGAAGAEVVEVHSLPEENDHEKLLSYKYENGAWVYDENKHTTIIAKMNEEKEIRNKTSTLESLQGKTDYIAMLMGVDFDV
jgi:hypothetical protein